MINEKNARRYCVDDISNIENYHVAVSDADGMWECHHRREVESTQRELKESGEYFNRPASELIFLPRGLHRTLIKGKTKTDSHRKHISEARKGMKFSDEHKRNLSDAHMGQTRSEESRMRQGAKVRGLRWFTDGTTSVRREECPEGFWTGRQTNNKRGV